MAHNTPHRTGVGPDRPALPLLARLMDIGGVLCVLLGETLAGILPFNIGSIFRYSTVLWFGIGLLLVRHVVQPRPTVFAGWLGYLRHYFRQPHVARVWGIALASRAIVLAIGVLAVTAAGYRPPDHAAGPVSASAVQDLPSRWDAQWYMSIARHGYRWDRRHPEAQQSIAFFPAYPALMRVAGDLLTIPAKALRDPLLFGSGDARVLWGGVLVSVLCFGVALQRIHRVALLDSHRSDAAFRSVLLLSTYPFALFFSAAYSESLAMLTLASAVLAWRQNQLRRAALWGFIAGLARSNGWALSVALLADWQLGSAARLGRLRALAAAMAPAVATGLYSTYIYTRTGHPFAWASAQRAWVGDVGPLFFLIRPVRQLEELGLAGFIQSNPVDLVSLACVALILGVAVQLARQRQWLYAALVLCYLAPALAIDLPAKGRLTAVLFPAFLALGTMTSRMSGLVLTLLFAVGQLWLAFRFFQWQSPF